MEELTSYSKDCSYHGIHYKIKIKSEDESLIIELE